MKAVLLFTTLILSVNLNAQNFQWAKSFGGSSDDNGNGIAVDALGNIYTAGFFEGTVDFDPGVGISNLTSVGGTDVFVQKLDPSGNFLWAKAFGGTSDDAGYSIAVDASGNLYITGEFRGTVDFDPGTGVSSHTSAGSQDIFVQKMDASGNFIWAKTFGGISFDEGYAIAVDPSGNVYTTGYFRFRADFDPGFGVATLNAATFVESDIFVQKMDASGNFLWAKAFGGSSFDEGYSIALDASGNVYTTGKFGGTVDFNPGSGTATLTSSGNEDVFIQKMDASGNFLWAKAFGGASEDIGYSVKVDNNGNVYTTGKFQGTVDFNPGSAAVNLTSNGLGDIFIQKLDASGNFLWAKVFGGSSNDRGGFSIATDASGSVYTYGDFAGTVDFDPGSGIANLTSFGFDDIFIQKMDSSGNFLWAVTYGATSDVVGNFMALDVLGNLYTTGKFELTIDFDPGVGISNLTSSGNEDVFVQKMSQLAVGLKDYNVEVERLIYPNPSNGVFAIDLGMISKVAKIAISDINGRLINSSVYNNSQILNVELEAPAGIYFLTVESDNYRAVSRLIMK